MSAVAKELSPPTIAEELSRKTMEHIEALIWRHSQKEITNNELRIGLKTVYSLASGMVDTSLMDLLCEAIKPYECREKSTRVFCDLIGLKAAIKFDDKEAVVFLNGRQLVRLVGENAERIDAKIAAVVKTLQAKGIFEWK